MDTKARLEAWKRYSEHAGLGVRSDTKVRREAVIELAWRHNYDANHSHQVECLAGTLFIELSEYHGLDRGDRHLLEFAAILHDIGYAVSAKGHHRHAFTMILSAPLLPFSRDDVNIIANVARYHRKRVPTLDHVSYAALNETDRRRVAAMAAMLRLADALDRSRKSLVQDLTCDVTEDSVIFNVISEEDLSNESAAVSRRGDLFLALFHKTPRVHVRVPRLIAPIIVSNRSSADLIVVRQKTLTPQEDLRSERFRWISSYLNVMLRALKPDP